MQLRKIITGFILIIVCSAHAMAQTSSASPPVERHFAVYAGFGPNYYFNNLVLGKDHVNSFNYSFTGRFMWEPEHLLSLGIESGYYRLYTLNSTQADQVHIANSAIPLQVVLSMKIYKKFYFDLSMGQSILLNKITTASYGNLSTSALSLGDFAGTLGYKHRLNKRFSIAGEAKFFYSSSFVDENISLMVVGGYRF